MRLRFFIPAFLVPLLWFCHLADAANARPSIKVRFLQPEAGQILSGMVEVRATFNPDPGAQMPRQAMVGIGGPPWVKMSRDKPGDDWAAVVDTTLVPNGAQELMVVSDQRFGRGMLKVTVTNNLKCVFADMHSHTSYSDGTMTPQTALDYARDTAKLSVFSLTDHLEKLNDEEWADLREQTDKANQDGAFVTLPGIEWTKQTGHACILDPRTRFWPAQLEDFYQAAADAGVIVKFNHPGPGTKVFNGLAYSEVGDKAFQLMEVRSSQEELAYVRALNQGWHLAPDGSDDTHAANWGNTRAWTGIWTPGLSRRNVWEALKARRCFSTLDKNCRLLFTANGREMGSILTDPIDCISIIVNVDDPDPSDNIAKIALFQDGEVVAVTEPGTATARWLTTLDVKPGSHYWFVKVTQSDGNTLWSAPIWATGRSGT